MVSKGNMRLLLAAAVCTFAFAQSTYDCGLDLVTRWNKFANDANAYVMLLHNGGVDRKQATRVEKEAQNVFKCECWK